MIGRGSVALQGSSVIGGRSHAQSLWSVKAEARTSLFRDLGDPVRWFSNE